MARMLLAGVAVGVALTGVAPATGKQLPFLRSASVSTRHVVVQIAVADVRPTQLTVARRADVGASGALLARNVVRREAIQLPSAAEATIVRWKSRTTLSPGTYFVQVTAVETDAGAVDCPPKLGLCLDRWSNVRRIVVPTTG